MRLLRNEVKSLKKAFVDKEQELAACRAMTKFISDEAEVKLRAAQEKYDSLQARYIELEEKLEIAEDNAKTIKEEHAEYEDIIRRNGGITISDAEKKVEELYDRCTEYKKRYGRYSWEFEEQLAELAKFDGLYRTVQKCILSLKRVFEEVEKISHSAGVPSTTATSASSRSRISDIFSSEFENHARLFEQGHGKSRARGRGIVRDAAPGRGIRGQALVRGAASGGRGQGRGRISIDDIMNSDFSNTWLNFSKPSSSS